MLVTSMIDNGDADEEGEPQVEGSIMEIRTRPDGYAEIDISVESTGELVTMLLTPGALADLLGLDNPLMN